MNSFRLEIIIGCMYSGKSTELMRRCLRYKAIGKNIVFINHINDTRTDNNIKTHEGTIYDAFKYLNLLQLANTVDLNKYDVIGIDEGQFFPDLKEFILYIEKYNKIIIVAGLDGDYQRKPMGQILEIIPLCDTVDKLTAMDMVDCNGTPGLFTKRIVNDDSQLLIGGKDKYMAVSRKNF
jgi:thymidine kinase